MIYAEAHAMAAALLMGATLIVKRKFSASSFFSDCAKFNATVVQVTALPSHICARRNGGTHMHTHACASGVRSALSTVGTAHTGVAHRTA